MSVDEAEPLVRVCGVRHHGPGSARAVLAVLEQIQPDAVLVEGPADADPLAALAAHDGLEPPVALLGYGVGNPRVSSFWPMAIFSPEWQAISWAARHEVPVRFMDLPAAVVLAAREAETAGQPSDDDGQAGDSRDDDRPSDSGLSSSDSGLGPGVDSEQVGPDADPERAGVDADPERAGADVAGPALRSDPLALLAHAAGYDDPERWWDDVIEGRRPATAPEPSPGQDPFDAITEAMAALRADRVEPADPDEARREAHMRQVLRATLKAGARRVVVVCGAWHAPALTLPLPPAAPDARLLRGLPKRKVELTWVPWTHSRLSLASGYGAGVTSPGWYAHLFACTERPVADWLTQVAGVLRRRDLPVSSAHVIEAVRLAETLAVLRGRPSAGLAEVNDATRAVICEGDDAGLEIVVRDLVVGERLGQVPEDSPTVPLEADLTATCRRLRIRRAPGPTEKDLDLRKTTDLERSALLHRLDLLDIAWGTVTSTEASSTGTFRESWRLDWQPEFAVAVIEASLWGTTVAAAAVARTCDRALAADLPGLTDLLERALLADLAEALPDLLGALEVRSARDHDLLELMRAFAPLVRSRRYGDVRGTDLASLDTVIDALLVRICVGLGAGVRSLDDAGATQLRTQVDAVHRAVGLRGDTESHARWLTALVGLVPRADVHPLLAGRIVRILVDAGEMSAEQSAQRLSRALSIGSDPAHKAAWVEGFLAGSGVLLVHDRDLLGLVDDWIRGLSEQEFLDAVALLRRTFGTFEAGERAAIGDAAAVLSGGVRPGTGSPVDWDPDRAAPVLATVAGLLGLRPLPEPGHGGGVGRPSRGPETHRPADLDRDLGSREGPLRRRNPTDQDGPSEAGEVSP
ncbi:MAG: DUF5682 family protein [Actinomycetales bacterium]